ncbi:hypothetical protein [Sedimentitalea todarodis]|uniref:Uncharacterized protein n=1 Tax=Sedimentitalea todarodis TaxID=1631240 RepID=A0ABU3V816_9RHOB|nr:hypothetical protein [Sedimentitalea todarodis]MDU9002301.1 hypothetical protein [Sedimentitalea todarodis]
MRTDLHRLVTMAVLLALWADGVAGQDAVADNWTRQKCDLYSAAWQDVQASFDTSVVSEEFLEKHQNFITLGCPADMRVCAVSPEEIELANLLTILSMNEGMASTFVPFGCPD